jgi:hypothetical protein
LTEKDSYIITPESQVKDAFLEIQTYIKAVENDISLSEERNFEHRVESLDLMEFEVFDLIEDLLSKSTQKETLLLLKARAEKLKYDLGKIDFNLFQKLREKIRTQKYAGEKFKNLIGKYIDFDLEDADHQQEAGYDNLDIFINGLFCFDAMPEQTKALEPGMVFYQKTPARIIFELVEKAGFNKDDVFFDLGSGLGQVGILVNLLAGIKTIGVEFEPAFYKYAKNCAIRLNLSDVSFINVDARRADYSAGTIFFMYTPFNGEIMEDVLTRLKQESLSRKIKVITYGPCSAQIALQSWLHSVSQDEVDIYKLEIFNSL